ncbi:MAG: protein arginine kinase [Phycisphaerales bacterium]
MSPLPDGPRIQPSGSDADVVASTRVRLARNVAGFPFVNRASAMQRQQILSMLQAVAFPPEIAPDMKWLNLAQTPPRDRMLLVERHLISRQLAEGDAPRSVAISGDETFSLMVNEEDHVRLQVVLPGLQLVETLRRADALDDAIEAQVDFSFSRRFGYLTACPTNVGCGIRVSVMLHLPALRITNEIERVRRAAKDLNLAVRGFYGEGSESAGDFYQVSNQVTLGVAEQDVLESFRRDIVPRMVDYEREARRLLARQSPAALDDRLCRALAVLRSARLLGGEEAMKLLSRVRLGIHVERLRDIDLRVVDRLMLRSSPRLGRPRSATSTATSRTSAGVARADGAGA